MDGAAEIINQAGDHRLIFVCDHASNAVPPEHASLGLPQAEFQRHIAYDIGAAGVTRAMAAAFNAPAVIARWSRLLIDLNRGADDPTLVMRLSDGAIIPGNAHVDDAEITRRIARFHAPYHQAIAGLIATARARSIAPVLVSIHSFTPMWKGAARPWHYGILYDRDRRLSDGIFAVMRELPGIVVGDNAPYSGELQGDTMNQHGTQNGLPHVLIEFRQDLVETPQQQREQGRFMARILRRALAETKLAVFQGGFGDE